MKLIMMVGVPGSGKSYVAKEIAKKENAVIVSSDKIREELYGNESIQGKPHEVFKRVYEDVDKNLALGKTVIIDATNISRNKRMATLKNYKNVYKECYYVSTPYEICVERDLGRTKKVGEHIVLKFFKQLQIPLVTEGFDKVHIVHTKKEYPITKEGFMEIVGNCPEYEELYEKLKDVSYFRDVYRFDQQSPYHQYLLCEHIYQTYAYINEMYYGEDKRLLQYVALLHDIGKPMCKRFRELKGYHTYYGHDLVSAQFACHFLTELGFEEEFVTKVVSLIEMHMFIHFGGPNAGGIIYGLLGEEMLSKLYLFKEADTFAK